MLKINKNKCTSLFWDIKSQRVIIIRDECDFLKLHISRVSYVCRTKQSSMKHNKSYFRELNLLYDNELDSDFKTFYRVCKSVNFNG